MSSAHAAKAAKSQESVATPAGTAEEQLAAGAAGNVDKIRDILFGAQIREYERRFVRMEEVMQRETSELRADVRKRLDTIEGFFKQEMQTIAERLRSEREERIEADREAAHQLGETNKALKKSVAQIEEALAAAQRELRQNLLDQSRQLSDEIGQTQTRLSSSLERRSSELQESKADRSTLAAILMEMAMRIGDSAGEPPRQNG
jgi:DNA repair exonuclease SbcCD ATPase subunit